MAQQQAWSAGRERLGSDQQQDVQRMKIVAYLVYGLVFSFSMAWLMKVNEIVPEPYLDEIFHVPQTQKYCEGRYAEWDDKITTPPGLYLLANAFAVIKQMIPFDFSSRKASAEETYFCSTSNLRLLNPFILGAICHCLWQVTWQQTTARPTQAKDMRWLLWIKLHTVANIGLFPLIMFFSGLFYTDLASLLTVAVAMSFTMNGDQGRGYGIGRGLLVTLLGLLALTMRQTNVFWVVVYLGGLEAVEAVRLIEPPPAKGAAPTGVVEKGLWMWKRASAGDVHDPPLADAWVGDWILTATTLLIAAVYNPIRVVRAIWPYLVVLATFITFVVWNGGVVLGDKSNHIATTHLPQMLYIWPLFAFFSWPVLVPRILDLTGQVISVIQTRHINITASKSSILLYGAYVVFTLAATLAIVHYNTIIHPFTLADNRHYMFYVFRYTIRKQTVRYWLVIVYTICRWACWGALSAPEPSIAKAQKPPGSGSSSKKSTSEATGVRISHAMIFLLATTLSLIKAPLVEPRYFLVPWVIWRLTLPQPSASGKSPTKAVLALCLETCWLLAVNYATMRIFLERPFLWYEDGKAIEGWQRFMW